MTGSGAAIYAAGDQIASGTKSAVLSTSQGEKLMYAVEATEVWFEHIGRDQLVNGSAHVELDPIFLETVEIDRNRPMQVFIQLNDDCNGTYFGIGSPLYWYASDDGEIDGMIRATDRQDARAQVIAMYPAAKVRR